MFADVPTGGGQFFKPQDFDGKVLLIETEDFKRDVPTGFGPKDEAVATITVFDSETATEPSEVNESMRVQQTALASTLAARVGQKMVVKLGKGSAKPGKQAPWVFNTFPAAYENVGAYVTKRDAALADAPSF